MTFTRGCKTGKAAALATLAALLPAGAGVAASSTTTSVSGHALLHSRQLWATIDVCNARDQPNYLGIRGSMPGDGVAHDKMYMSFRVEYRESEAKQWTDLAHASTEWTAVGGGASARQGGTSFQIVPVAGKPAYTFRGVVSFQWRHGKTVLESASRVTTAQHQSVAGSDPAGFSAATCQIG